MLPETDIQRIREEAEKKYPDSNFEWVNRIIEARRDTYIDTATLYQERINILMEAIDVVKKWLPDGPSNELKKYLDTYNKTINNG